MKVYIIKRDYSHQIDDENDANHLEFPDCKMIASRLIGIRDIILPKTIYFRANLNLISKIDFPINSLNIPIFSKRMYEIFNKLSIINHRLISVIMIDDTFMGEIFDQNGKLLKNIKTNDMYCSFQIMNYIDAFDYDKSVYKNDPILPVGYISKLVLKTPKEGFHSIFKIKESMNMLFISEETKEALEKNNIRGCVFEEVEVNQNIT